VLGTKGPPRVIEPDEKLVNVELNSFVISSIDIEPDVDIGIPKFYTCYITKKYHNLHFEILKCNVIFTFELIELSASLLIIREGVFVICV